MQIKPYMYILLELGISVTVNVSSKDLLYCNNMLLICFNANKIIHVGVYTTPYILNYNMF